MKIIIVFVSSIFFMIGYGFSQSVKVDTIYSGILKKKIPTTVILPSNYDVAKQYPIFYLLHWWSADNNSFLKTNLLLEIKDKELIIVTPYADTSWYVNSYSNPNNRYEDFMSLELFKYIDKKYNIDAKRQAIGGFSMGGYGALLIGLKHPERFKFVADISGLINAPSYDIPLTPQSPLNYVINSLRISFGDENSVVPDSTNIFSLIKHITPSENTFIYMAVGKHDQFDFIVPQHKRFIQQLDRQKLKYQYLEFDGGHFDGKVLAASMPSLFKKLTETLK
ncbi:MAG: alpha/beta hydrolase-fold protein [Chitinophagaceae bacterium]